MKRPPLVILLVIAAVVLAGAGWWWTHRRAPSNELELFGNVDLRQVELAFNGAERVSEVLANEGDRVAKGQVLARLDTSRLDPELAQAQAQADAQEQALTRLRNGSRPEEISQAQANVASAAADAETARLHLQRLTALAQDSAGRALSKQDLDDARAAAAASAAKLDVNRQALRLAQIGPRKEDIAQAAAQLAAVRAQLALLRQERADATLKAPLNAVVRSRLAEVGEMSSPQKPAFTLAITDPKWVRAYVSETDLGAVRAGMGAGVFVDAFKDRRFEGWVGFISPVAEFTPKSVQTPELRTSLVYEIRVFVKDPRDELKLGMPATVRLPLAATASGHGR
ncbi:MAG: efflux RND transporter periplasmic adaptor subunit [Caulobacteraceae bacterium]|nr:efflux RND transporter periplasmic adaptor subunit [Caulobacteraceae bacterium]